MSRLILPALAALVLVTASLIPDDAYARGGRGAGGYHGGGVRAGGGYRGGAVYAGRGYAGRSYRVAGRYGYRGGYYRRYGYGAAAVVGGAALYGAYNNGCYYDAYGQYICAGQYPYYRY